jgi:C-terminal processing protease CtpA/Prc
VIAVLVDSESSCIEYGIHDGTVITKWDGIPVDEAAEKVLCLDASYEFKTWENIHIAQPIFLAGQGGDEVEVTFINDAGDEKTVTLTAKGDYYNRRTAALDIIYDSNVIQGENYSNRIINENIGYIRINEEEYSTDPWFNTKCTLSSFSKDIYEDLYRRLEAMKKEGVDRIILDLRNNNGGYGFESRTVASLFVDGDIPCKLQYDKDGKAIVASTVKPIENQGPFSDMKVVVLVNGETCSAGELMTYYLANAENVIIVGSTSTWGAAQSTGGSAILTDSKYSIRFPILPETDENGLPCVDVGADYHTRIEMDYVVEYDLNEAVNLFEHPENDYVLEKAIDYISN